MAIKKRNHPAVTSQDDQGAAIEKLAQEMSDKPYGDEPRNVEEDVIVRTSFTLPLSMQTALEDMAIKNKRSGKNLKTVSAIIREAVEVYLKGM